MSINYNIDRGLKIPIIGSNETPLFPLTNKVDFKFLHSYNYRDILIDLYRHTDNWEYNSGTGTGKG